MDAHKISEQAARIDYNEKGIDWIEKFVLTPEDNPLSQTPTYSTERWMSEVRVRLPAMASSLTGAKEAESLINFALREFMPQIVETALQIGKAANAEAKQIIKDEVAK